MKKKTKKRTKTNKIETSKKIIGANYVLASILILALIIGTFMGYDMENITHVTVLIIAEVGASNVFYYNKAAKENVPKILSGLNEELIAQIDINKLLNNN